MAARIAIRYISRSPHEQEVPFPMRLWSLHPEYLDRIGLVALWREGLLAQKVLLGKTKGYTHHPQLDRFRSCSDPAGAVGAYLLYIAQHAATRGYRFDTGKVVSVAREVKIAIPAGQIMYEFSHLMKKCAMRSPQQYKKYHTEKKIRLHPIFHRVKGGIAPWEKVSFPDEPTIKRASERGVH